MPIKFDTTTRTPLTEGGEGYIYEYNGKIIKTFKPHIDIAAKERKINALMKTNLPQDVIKPIDTVLDMRGRFIGYSMEKVIGEEFKRLSNRKFVTANNITTKDILSMLVNVKMILESLHKQHIYIGDLNDQNILFDTVRNVYLIDCDSWSVGNDKCTVAMDMFKDPKLQADNFNADTDNYAFAVLAWKSLTRVHPFGGTMEPDIPILERMKKGISVIERPEVKLPRATKDWKGFSPYMIAEFQLVFECGLRKLADNMEDMLANLTFCKKDKEYYYSKFSSCPYCDSSAQINKKPISKGIVGGLKLYAVYDSDRVTAVFDRQTYLNKDGLVVSGSNAATYQKGIRYYFLGVYGMVEDMNDRFIIHTPKEYAIDKKYKSSIEAVGNKIYYISPKNTFSQIEVMKQGNAIKNICKVSGMAYFAVRGENYCVINYYTGKLIVNINGTNTIVDYDSDIINYGIHYDDVSGKWLIILEDSSGRFNTYIIGNGSIEYHTNSIKYSCQLNCPCISNSTIFIPVDGKIRGFSYQKSVFKDFECNVVSEESKLIKEKGRFVIVNMENVYILEPK